MQAQQGRRTRTPSVGGTSSLYSYASTTRTMSRSMKSLRIAWYKKPLVQDAFVTDIQTGAMITAVFSMVGKVCISVNVSLLYKEIFYHLGDLPVHYCNRSARHILFGDDQTWSHSLWLLYHEFSVCLCWQWQCTQHLDCVCPVFSHCSSGSICDQLHFVESPPQRD